MSKSRRSKHKAYSHVFLIILLICTGYFLFVFMVKANLKEVVPNKIYRSAKPSSFHLKLWSKKYGIKTIINLRVRKPEDYEKEKVAAEQLGIKLVSVYLSGHRLISSQELLTLIDALEAAEPPILIHCRSGIDRSGTVSVLAAMAVDGIDYNVMKKQAYVPPGPWKRKDHSATRPDYIHDYAHISDTLRVYESYCESMNIDTNNWEQFKLWATNLPPVKELDIKYESSYSCFPFLNKDKKFFPVLRLLKDSYIQFAIQVMIIILLALLSGNHKARNRI